MKNLIEFICFTLIITLLFTGCTLFDTTKETTTVLQTTETKKEPATQQAEESTTVQQTEYLNVSESDLELFREMFCGYHYDRYDSETATEKDVVRLLTDGYVCQGLISIAKSLKSFPEEAFSQYADGNADDPMGHFEHSYVWIREDMFDFISQNIFGVAFPHEYDPQSENNLIYYYCDGYFYFSCTVTGLEPEDILINDCVRQEDGRYLLKTELTGGSLEMDGEIYHIEYGDFLAGVVEKDGIRCWEISEIHTY